jgi:hypothetical protein
MAGEGRLKIVSSVKCHRLETGMCCSRNLVKENHIRARPISKGSVHRQAESAKKQSRCVA